MAYTTYISSTHLFPTNDPPGHCCHRGTPLVPTPTAVTQQSTTHPNPTLGTQGGAPHRHHHHRPALPMPPPGSSACVLGRVASGGGGPADQGRGRGQRPPPLPLCSRTLLRELVALLGDHQALWSQELGLGPCEVRGRACEPGCSMAGRAGGGARVCDAGLVTCVWCTGGGRFRASCKLRVPVPGWGLTQGLMHGRKSARPVRLASSCCQLVCPVANQSP